MTTANFTAIDHYAITILNDRFETKWLRWPKILFSFLTFAILFYPMWIKISFKNLANSVKFIWDIVELCRANLDGRSVYKCGVQSSQKGTGGWIDICHPSLQWHIKVGERQSHHGRPSRSSQLCLRRYDPQEHRAWWMNGNEVCSSPRISWRFRFTYNIVPETSLAQT